MSTATLRSTAADSLDPDFVRAFRSGTLTPEHAEAVFPRDRTACIFLLLQLSATIAAAATAPASGPHTPSGSIPPYAKPAAKPRRKKRGGQPGHPGTSRPIPTIIDHHQTHQLSSCPCCGGRLTPTGRTRTRIVEDIPEDLKPEVTEHTIHRDWCPRCQKQVEPKVPDALPQCPLGNRAVALTAWLHYGVGTTTRQIVDVFNHHLKLPISDGGLTQIWHRLADVLTPWYDQIQRHCLEAGVLHADETGWRVEGQSWWLWCFCTPDAAYYLIDESRGHPALDLFFIEEFRGILVTDFWKAYDAIGRTKQKCWPHLLRELKEIDEKTKTSGDWAAFAKRLRRIYGDAIRLETHRAAMHPDTFQSRLCALHARTIALAAQTWFNDDARRLANRLATYGADLLTFVEFEGVPADNNRGERTIRPAVQMRKSSFGNQSERGARTRSVLMSVYRTLKQRGLDPLDVTVAALRAHAETGVLPPLPERAQNTS
jgi:transposase